MDVWLIDWLIGWVLEWLIAWCIVWLNDCPMHGMHGYFIDWTIGWMLERLIIWCINWLKGGRGRGGGWERKCLKKTRTQPEERLGKHKSDCGAPRRLVLLFVRSQCREGSKWKSFFSTNYGWYHHLEMLCFGQVRVNTWKKDDQKKSILLQADWPEPPYEVDFCNNS